jgi:hypothetical protein
MTSSESSAKPPELLRLHTLLNFPTPRHSTQIDEDKSTISPHNFPIIPPHSNDSPRKQKIFLIPPNYSQFTFLVQKIPENLFSCHFLMCFSYATSSLEEHFLIIHHRHEKEKRRNNFTRGELEEDFNEIQVSSACMTFEFIQFKRSFIVASNSSLNLYS